MKDPDLFNIIWAAFEPSSDSMLLSYHTLNPPPLVFLDKFCSLSCPGVAAPSPLPLQRLLKTRPLRKDKYLYLYVHRSHYRRFDREGERGGNLTRFFYIFFNFSKRHEPKDPPSVEKVTLDSNSMTKKKIDFSSYSTSMCNTLNYDRPFLSSSGQSFEVIRTSAFDRPLGARWMTRYHKDLS